MSYQQGPGGRRSDPYRQRGLEDSRYGPGSHPHLGSYNHGGLEEERQHFRLPEPVRGREYPPSHCHTPPIPPFSPNMSLHYSREAEFAYERERFGGGGDGGVSVGHDHAMPPHPLNSHHVFFHSLPPEQPIQDQPFQEHPRPLDLPFPHRDQHPPPPPSHHDFPEHRPLPLFSPQGPPVVDFHQETEWDNSHHSQGGSFNPMAEDFSRPPSDYFPPADRRISDQFGVDRLMIEEMQPEMSSPVPHTDHTGFDSRRENIFFLQGNVVGLPSRAEQSILPDSFPREGRRDSYSGSERERRESSNSSCGWAQNKKASNYSESRFGSAVRDNTSHFSGGSRHERERNRHHQRSSEEQRRGRWKPKPHLGRPNSRDESSDTIRVPRRQNSSDSVSKRASNRNQRGTESSKSRSEWQDKERWWREKRKEDKEKFLGAQGVSGSLARRPLREHDSSPEISGVSVAGPASGPVPIQERLGPQVPGMGSVQNRLGPPKESVHSRLGPEERLGPPPSSEGVHSRLGPQVSSPSPRVKIEPPSLSPQTTLTTSVLTEPPTLNASISVKLEGGRDPEMEPDLREELQERWHSRMAPELDLPSSENRSSSSLLHRESPSPPPSHYSTHQPHLSSTLLPSSSSTSSLAQPHPMEKSLTSPEVPPAVSLSQGGYIDQHNPTLAFTSSDRNDHDHSSRRETRRSLDPLPGHLDSHPAPHSMERVEAEARLISGPLVLFPSHESQISPSPPPGGKDSAISSSPPSRPPSTHESTPPRSHHSSSTHRLKLPIIDTCNTSRGTDAMPHLKPPSLPQDMMGKKPLHRSSQYSAKPQAARAPVVDKKRPSSLAKVDEDEDQHSLKKRSSSAKVGEERHSPNNESKSGSSSRDVYTSTHTLSEKPPLLSSKNQLQRIPPGRTQSCDSPKVVETPPESSTAVSSLQVEVKHRRSSGVELDPMECGYSKRGVVTAAVAEDSEPEDGEITDSDSEPGLVIDLEHSSSSPPKPRTNATEKPTGSGILAREQGRLTEPLPGRTTPSASTSKVLATRAQYGSQGVSNSVRGKAVGRSSTPLQDPRLRLPAGKSVGVYVPSPGKSAGKASVTSPQTSSQTTQTGQSSSSTSSASRESKLQKVHVHVHVLQAPTDIKSTSDEERRKDVQRTKPYKLASIVLSPPMVEALATVKCEGRGQPLMWTLRSSSAQLHRVLHYLFQDKNQVVFNTDAAMSYVQTHLPKSAAGVASISKLGRLVAADCNCFFLYELHILSKELGDDVEKWKSYAERYRLEMREMSASILKKRFPYGKKEVNKTLSSQVIEAKLQFQKAMGKQKITYQMLDEEETSQPSFLEVATQKYGLPLTQLLEKASLDDTSKRKADEANMLGKTGSMQPQINPKPASSQGSEAVADKKNASLIKQASAVLSLNLAKALGSCTADDLPGSVLQRIFSSMSKLHRLLHFLFNRKKETGISTDAAVCYIQARLPGSPIASASVEKIGTLLSVNIGFFFRHELHFLGEHFKGDVEKWRNFALKYSQEMKELTPDKLRKKFPKREGLGMNLHLQVITELQKASHQKAPLYTASGGQSQPPFIETAKQMFGRRLTQLLGKGLPPCSPLKPAEHSVTPTSTPPPADKSVPISLGGSHSTTSSAKAVSPTQPAVPIQSPVLTSNASSVTSPSPIPVSSPVPSSIPPLFSPGSSVGCVAMLTAHTTIPPLFPTMNVTTTSSAMQDPTLPFSPSSPVLPLFPSTPQEEIPKAPTPPLPLPSRDKPPTSIPPLFPPIETSHSIPPLFPSPENISALITTCSTSTTSQSEAIPPLFPLSQQSQTTPASCQSNEGKSLDVTSTSSSRTIVPIFSPSHQPQAASLPCQSNEGMSLDDTANNEMDRSTHLNSNKPLPSSDRSSAIVGQPSADEPSNEANKCIQSPAQERQFGINADSKVALMEASVSHAEGSEKRTDTSNPSLPDHTSPSQAEEERPGVSTSDDPCTRERKVKEEGGAEGGEKQKVVLSEGREDEETAPDSDKMSISSGEIISPTPSPPSHHDVTSSDRSKEKAAESPTSHHRPVHFSRRRVGSEEPYPFWSARSHPLSEQSDWRIRTEIKRPERRETLPRTHGYRRHVSPSPRYSWREREFERGGGRRDGRSRGRAERYRRFRSRSRSVSPVMRNRRRHRSHSPDGRSTRFGLRPHQYLRRRSREKREGGRGVGRGEKERARATSKEERRREPEALYSDEDLEVLELRKEAIMSMLKGNEGGERGKEKEKKEETGKKKGEDTEEGQENDREEVEREGSKEAGNVEQDGRGEDTKAISKEVVVVTELSQGVKASEKEREEADEVSEVRRQPTVAVTQSPVPCDDETLEKNEIVLSPSSSTSPPIKKTPPCTSSSSSPPIPPSLPHIPLPPSHAKALLTSSTSTASATKPSKPPPSVSKALTRSLSASLSVPPTTSSPKTGSVGRAVAVSLLKPGSPKPSSLPSSRSNSRRGSPSSSLGSPAPPPGVDSGPGRSGIETGDLTRRGSTVSHKPLPSVKVLPGSKMTWEIPAFHIQVEESESEVEWEEEEEEEEGEGEGEVTRGMGRPPTMDEIDSVLVLFRRDAEARAKESLTTSSPHPPLSTTSPPSSPPSLSLQMREPLQSGSSMETVKAVGMLSLEQQREYLELKKKLFLHARRQSKGAVGVKGKGKGKMPSATQQVLKVKADQSGRSSPTGIGQAQLGDKEKEKEQRRKEAEEERREREKKMREEEEKKRRELEEKERREREEKEKRRKAEEERKAREKKRKKQEMRIAESEGKIRSCRSQLEFWQKDLTSVTLQLTECESEMDECELKMELLRKQLELAKEAHNRCQQKRTELQNKVRITKDHISRHNAMIQETQQQLTNERDLLISMEMGETHEAIPMDIEDISSEEDKEEQLTNERGSPITTEMGDSHKVIPMDIEDVSSEGSKGEGDMDLVTSSSGESEGEGGMTTRVLKEARKDKTERGKSTERGREGQSMPNLSALPTLEYESISEAGSPAPNVANSKPAAGESDSEGLEPSVGMVTEFNPSLSWGASKEIPKPGTSISAPGTRPEPVSDSKTKETGMEIELVPPLPPPIPTSPPPPCPSPPPPPPQGSTHSPSVEKGGVASNLDSQKSGENATARKSEKREERKKGRGEGKEEISGDQVEVRETSFDPSTAETRPLPHIQLDLVVISDTDTASEPDLCPPSSPPSHTPLPPPPSSPPLNQIPEIASEPTLASLVLPASLITATSTSEYPPLSPSTATQSEVQMQALSAEQPDSKGLMTSDGSSATQNLFISMLKISKVESLSNSPDINILFSPVEDKEGGVDGSGESHMTNLHTTSPEKHDVVMPTDHVTSSEQHTVVSGDHMALSEHHAASSEIATTSDLTQLPAAQDEETKGQDKKEKRSKENEGAKDEDIQEERKQRVETMDESYEASTPSEPSPISGVEGAQSGIVQQRVPPSHLPLPSSPPSHPPSHLLSEPSTTASKHPIAKTSATSDEHNSDLSDRFSRSPGALDTVAKRKQRRVGPRRHSSSSVPSVVSEGGEWVGKRAQGVGRGKAGGKGVARGSSMLGSGRGRGGRGRRRRCHSDMRGESVSSAGVPSDAAVKNKRKSLLPKHRPSPGNRDPLKPTVLHSLESPSTTLNRALSNTLHSALSPALASLLSPSSYCHLFPHQNPPLPSPPLSSNSQGSSKVSSPTDFVTLTQKSATLSRVIEQTLMKSLPKLRQVVCVEQAVVVHGGNSTCSSDAVGTEETLEVFAEDAMSISLTCEVSTQTGSTTTLPQQDQGHVPLASDREMEVCSGRELRSLTCSPVQTLSVGTSTTTDKSELLSPMRVLSPSLSCSLSSTLLTPVSPHLPSQTGVLLSTKPPASSPSPTMPFPSILPLRPCQPLPPPSSPPSMTGTRKRTASAVAKWTHTSLGDGTVFVGGSFNPPLGVLPRVVPNIPLEIHSSGVDAHTLQALVHARFASVSESREGNRGSSLSDTTSRDVLLKCMESSQNDGTEDVQNECMEVLEPRQSGTPQDVNMTAAKNTTTKALQYESVKSVTQSKTSSPSETKRPPPKKPPFSPPSTQTPTTSLTAVPKTTPTTSQPAPPPKKTKPASVKPAKNATSKVPSSKPSQNKSDATATKSLPPSTSSLTPSSKSLYITPKAGKKVKTQPTVSSSSTSSSSSSSASSSSSSKKSISTQVESILGELERMKATLEKQQVQAPSGKGGAKKQPASSTQPPSSSSVLPGDKAAKPSIKAAALLSSKHPQSSTASLGVTSSQLPLATTTAAKPGTAMSVSQLHVTTPSPAPSSSSSSKGVQRQQSEKRQGSPLPSVPPKKASAAPKRSVSAPGNVKASGAPTKTSLAPGGPQLPPAKRSKTSQAAISTSRGPHPLDYKLMTGVSSISPSSSVEQSTSVKMDAEEQGQSSSLAYMNNVVRELGISSTWKDLQQNQPSPSDGSLAAERQSGLPLPSLPRFAVCGLNIAGQYSPSIGSKPLLVSDSGSEVISHSVLASLERLNSQTIAQPTTRDFGRPSLRYHPYSSPLLSFRSYRLSPYYRTHAKLPLSSLSHSNKIDPMQIMCKFDILGKCNDPKCTKQHFRDIKLSKSELVEDIATYNPLPGSSSTVGGLTSKPSSSETSSSSSGSRVSPLAEDLIKTYSGKISDEQLLILAAHRVNENREGQEREGGVVGAEEERLRSTGSVDGGSREKGEVKRPSLLWTVEEEKGDTWGESSLQDSAATSHTFSTTSTQHQEGSLQCNRYFTPSPLPSPTSHPPSDPSSVLLLTRRADKKEEACTLLEEALKQHPGSEELWVEYLHLKPTTFSPADRHEDQDRLLTSALSSCPTHATVLKCVELSQTLSDEEKWIMKGYHTIINQPLSPATSLCCLELLLSHALLCVLVGQTERAVTAMELALGVREDSSSDQHPFTGLHNHLSLPHLQLGFLTLLHTLYTGTLPLHLLQSPLTAYPPVRLGHVESLVLPWSRHRSLTSDKLQRIEQLLAVAITRCQSNDPSNSMETTFALYHNLILFQLTHRTLQIAQETLNGLLNCSSHSPKLWLLAAQFEERTSNLATALDVLKKVPVNQLHSKGTELYCYAIKLALTKAMKENKSDHLEAVLPWLHTCLCQFYRLPHPEQLQLSDTVLLHRKLLGQMVPYDYSTPEMIDRERHKECLHHLWVAYCVLVRLTCHTLHGDFFHSSAEDAYESAVHSVNRTDHLQTVWLEYLTYLREKALQNKEQLSSFKAFSDCVHRCLVVMETRCATPHPTCGQPTHYHDLTFNEQVCELYLSCLPPSSPFLLSTLHSFSKKFPHNPHHVIRLVSHCLSHCPTSLDLAQTCLANFLSKTPKCLYLWRLAIAVELKQKKSREARWMFREAVKLLPLSAELWKEVHPQLDEFPCAFVAALCWFLLFELRELASLGSPPPPSAVSLAREVKIRAAQHGIDLTSHLPPPPQYLEDTQHTLTPLANPSIVTHLATTPS